MNVTCLVDSYSGVATLLGLRAAGGEVGTVVATDGTVERLARRAGAERVTGASEEDVPAVLTGLVRPDDLVLSLWWNGDPQLLGKVGAPVAALHEPVRGRRHGVDPLVWAIAGGARGIRVRLVRAAPHGGWAVRLDGEVPVADHDLPALGEAVGGWLHGHLAADPESTGTEPPCALPEPRARIAVPELLDWALPAARVARLVAALCAPGPGACTVWRGNRLGVGRAAVGGAGGENCPPGTILAVSPDGLDVRAGDGVVRVGRLRDLIGDVDTAQFVPGERLGADLVEQTADLRQRVTDLEHVVRALAATHDLLAPDRV